MIAQHKDYSVRVAAQAEDETGMLVRSFNTMLQTIEAQNTELVDSNRWLEQRVKRRTFELQQAKERAEDAESVKSSFLATRYSEVRTPLNSIIGFSGILMQGLAGPLNAEQYKQMGMVCNSAEHLLALINDVLDLSKIEDGGELQLCLERFDLGSSIEKVVDAVPCRRQRRASRSRLSIGPGVGIIASDRRRVEQCPAQPAPPTPSSSPKRGVCASRRHSARSSSPSA